jgi:hypothetical protein
MQICNLTLATFVIACMVGCRGVSQDRAVRAAQGVDEIAVAFPFRHLETGGLARAAAAGDAATVQKLVRAGVSANARGRDGITLLMWSILHSSLVGCEALLAAGASPTLADDSGDCALTLAARHPDASFLRAVLDHTKEVETPGPSGITALAFAAGADQVVNVEVLLAAGADPNGLDHLARGPLFHAIEARSAAAMRRLLRAGANPFQADVDGITPYELAHRTRERPLLACFASRTAPDPRFVHAFARIAMSLRRW